MSALPPPAQLARPDRSAALCCRRCGRARRLRLGMGIPGEPGASLVTRSAGAAWPAAGNSGICEGLARQQHGRRQAGAAGAAWPAAGASGICKGPQLGRRAGRLGRGCLACSWGHWLLSGQSLHLQGSREARAWADSRHAAQMPLVLLQISSAMGQLRDARSISQPCPLPSEDEQHVSGTTGFAQQLRRLSGLWTAGSPLKKGVSRRQGPESHHQLLQEFWATELLRNPNAMPMTAPAPARLTSQDRLHRSAPAAGVGLPD